MLRLWLSIWLQSLFPSSWPFPSSPDPVAYLQLLQPIPWGGRTGNGQARAAGVCLGSSFQVKDGDLAAFGAESVGDTLIILEHRQIAIRCGLQDTVLYYARRDRD